PDVTPMSTADASELFDSFARDCVRKDLVDRFSKDFGRRGITRRFFPRYLEKNLDMSFDEIFDRAVPKPVRAEVLWGSSDSPIAFRLSGDPSNAGRLFVDEGDAIARVALSQGVGYLFLSALTGELFVTPAHP